LVRRFVFPVKEPSPARRLAVHFDQVRPLRSSPVTGLRRYYAPLRLLLRPDRPRRFTACARRRTLPSAGGDLIPYPYNPSGHSTLADPAAVMTGQWLVEVSPALRRVYLGPDLTAFAIRGAARLCGGGAYGAHNLEVHFGCGLPDQHRLLPTCPRGHAVTGPSRPNDLINRMRLSLMDCWFQNRTHGLDGAGWAEQEFGGCELGDKRLTRRLVKLIGEEAAQPGASHAQAAGGDPHQLKACYRFLNNDSPELDVASILQTHRRQTLRRMKPHPTVLIVQDTTDLNFSSRPQCAGLGQTTANQTGAKTRGLKLHSSLAVEAAGGLPLGVLRLHGYAPEPAKGKDPHRPIEQKESNRWLEAYRDANDIAALLPGTRIVSVTDREGDMFELFDQRRRQPGAKAHLLVRAKWDRNLEGTDATLFAEVAAAPLARTVKITVPRQREHPGKPSDPGRPALPARQAQVEVRYKEVPLSAPHKPQTRERPPLRLWAIYLEEKNPPTDATAVRWLLLTTVQVASAKQALRSIRWYCRRWRIEEWHRVMKSGCKILEHQNHSATVLLRAITLDAVIAWRIMLLGLLGRTVPGLPCDLLFNPCECEVLELLASKKTLPG